MNSNHTNPDERIIKLMHEAASQAAPDHLDLWPQIVESIRPQSRRASWRLSGALTAVAATVIVIVLAAIFMVLRGDDSGSLTVGGLQNVTPTISPEPIPVIESLDSAPGEVVASTTLCRIYPRFCVPYVGGVAPDHPLANVETPGHTGAVGVVRGLTPEGIPFIGSPAAPAQIEVVMDFSCEHCQTFWAGDLARFIDEYVLTGQAVLRLRLIAPEGSAYDQAAAEAAYAAGEQGAFWEMVDALFALSNQVNLSETQEWELLLRDLASQIGIDGERLVDPWSAHLYEPFIRAATHDPRGEPVIAVPDLWIMDGVSGGWEQVWFSYDTLASAVQAANEQPGIVTMDSVIVAEETFSEPIYTDKAELTRNNPVGGYVFRGNQAFFDALDETDGWALLTAYGRDSVPHLNLWQFQVASGDEARAKFTSREGAILFKWADLSDDVLGYFQMSYVAHVEAPYQSASTEYTLTLQPAPAARDLSAGPQTITLDYAAPQIIAFIAPDTDPVRLTITVDSTLTPEQALSSFYIPLPEIAVSAPHGETITTFEPERTDRLEIDFMPSSAGEQFLVFNPLDTAATAGREPVTFTVTVNPASTDHAGTISGDYTLWGCTTTIGEGTPPTSSPLAEYDIVQEYVSGFAEGADLAAETGSSVMAAGAGTVVFAGWNEEGYGNTVVIAHGTVFSLYAHLDSVMVTCGDSVQAGGVIGTVGSTGQVTGPHLHFEVRDADWDTLDPMSAVTDGMSSGQTPTSVPIILPANTIALAIPPSNYLIAGDGTANIVGRRVDVRLTFVSAEAYEEFQTGTPVTQKVIESALVVHAEPFPGGKGIILMLAVSPEEAQVLTWAVDSGLPVVLLPLAEN